MKTPFIHISFLFLLVVSLILISSFLGGKGSDNRNSPAGFGFLSFEQKSGLPQSLNSFAKEETVPPAFYKEAKAEFERIKAQFATEQESYFKKIDKEKEKSRIAYLGKRGLRLVGDKAAVNYQQSVQNNRPRVKQVFKEMLKKNESLTLQQFLALMLAFIQEVIYGTPPIKEGDKVILGFFTPPKVLVEDFGDCDSKGVTFASLWTNFKNYPLILIKIPNHMFVGLAIPSFSQEGVTINGLRYTLCEVTGPDKILPGIITPYSQFYLQGGQFRYELIR